MCLGSVQAILGRWIGVFRVSASNFREMVYLGSVQTILGRWMGVFRVSASNFREMDGCV